jgi:hypothetical protein
MRLPSRLPLLTRRWSLRGRIQSHIPRLLISPHARVQRRGDQAQGPDAAPVTVLPFCQQRAACARGRCLRPAWVLVGRLRYVFRRLLAVTGTRPASAPNRAAVGVRATV